MIRIQALYTYPIKSCAAVAHTHIALTPTGLDRDRGWMIVDAQGRFISQRERGELALLRAAWDGDTLCVEHPRCAAPLRLPPELPTTPRVVSVWRDTLTAQDAGDEAAAWISRALADTARLVRLDPDHPRLVAPHRAPPGNPVSFADAFPLLVASQASLDALNARLTAPVPMLRFRPNIVLEGCDPFEEDRVTGLRAPSGATFLRMDPCVRCRVVQLDPHTGDHTGKEPLATLAQWRHDPRLGGPTFGCNYIAPHGGMLRVGDALTPPGP